MLGLALSDRFVDAMVRPEFVMKAMSEAKLEVPGVSRRSKPAPDGSQGSGPDKAREVRWTVEREGVDRVVAYGAKDDQEPVAKRVGFVFERSGFATWRLSDLRLPGKD